jgi:hypothetical protein
MIVLYQLSIGLKFLITLVAFEFLPAKKIEFHTMTIGCNRYKKLVQINFPHWAMISIDPNFGPIEIFKYYAHTSSYRHGIGCLTQDKTNSSTFYDIGKQIPCRLNIVLLKFN